MFSEEELISDFHTIINKQLTGYTGDKDQFIDDIFKLGVATVWDQLQKRQGNKNRLEYDTVKESKRIMIKAFMTADLGDSQKNEDYYSQLFDQTVQEILETAAANHEGKDVISRDRSILS